MVYDIFNGDADGVCALVQLRLAEPKDSILITGVKRDIELVQQVPIAHPVQVNVLDISFDKNRSAVERLLEIGCDVFYVDHHFPGDVLPSVENFHAIIDTQSTTCTSLLMNQYLGGRYQRWAVTAAFGDNLDAVATRLAKAESLSEEQIYSLRNLGICLNYNGYGATVDDLYFHPAALFKDLVEYADPLDFIAQSDSCYQQLYEGYQSDLAQGLAADILQETSASLVISLPNEAWARRISGVLGNQLANSYPDKACAILTNNGNKTYVVSIRAPINNREGADVVARSFPTGGGRKAAAGINTLPDSQLDSFLDMMAHFWRK